MYVLIVVVLACNDLHTYIALQVIAGCWAYLCSLRTCCAWISASMFKFLCVPCHSSRVTWLPHHMLPSAVRFVVLSVLVCIVSVATLYVFVFHSTLTDRTKGRTLPVQGRTLPYTLYTCFLMFVGVWATRAKCRTLLVQCRTLPYKLYTFWVSLCRTVLTWHMYACCYPF